MKCLRLLKEDAPNEDSHHNTGSFQCFPQLQRPDESETPFGFQGLRLRPGPGWPIEWGCHGGSHQGIGAPNQALDQGRQADQSGGPDPVTSKPYSPPVMTRLSIAGIPIKRATANMLGTPRRPLSDLRNNSRKVPTAAGAMPSQTPRPKLSPNRKNPHSSNHWCQ